MTLIKDIYHLITKEVNVDMSTFEHDLTKGNIWKQLVWFAVPFLSVI